MRSTALGPACIAPMIVLPIAAAAQAQLSVAPADKGVFCYHRPDILGTTLDLQLVAASQADADACEQSILTEIERLRSILSTYDPQSEISKFETDPSTSPITVSSDLHSVLADYQHWHSVSGGAYSLQLGELIDLWSAAEKKGTPPTEAEISPLLARARLNAFIILPDMKVRKLSGEKLNIDSLGKGYIVQKAVAVARAAHPLVTGILLNIGGDITTAGPATPPSVVPPQSWNISVADPMHPADGAAPVTTLSIRDKSIATSGTYERFYTFGEKKLSHILNPFTGKPSTNDVLSATVVAPDNTTANALATTLCVLSATDGIKLVERVPGVAAMLIMAGGKQIESKGFAAYKIADNTPAASSPAAAPTASESATAPAAADHWPANFTLSVDLHELPFPPHPDYIPYTTMWIEDTDGSCVKILAAWIGDKKYLRSMRKFPNACKSSPDYTTMTRATRPVGRYTITWDGTDAQRRPVATGSYFLCIEVCCEHGGRSIARQAITCNSEPAKTQFPGALLWAPLAVKYGPPTPKTDSQ